MTSTTGLLCPTNASVTLHGSAIGLSCVALLHWGKFMMFEKLAAAVSGALQSLVTTKPPLSMYLLDRLKF